MLLYGVALFLSSFLLFLIQPMVAKSILPRYGGTPAVWTTCMLFFQAFLLGGYGYAHGLASRAAPRRQGLIHALLACGTVLVVTWFSIIPARAWRPPDDQFPVVRILGHLLACIGAPYFLLSSTAPLLQHWFSRTQPGASPYRLYALSNLGSLLAILGYPFLIEPAFSLRRQAAIWTAAYFGLALMILLLSVRLGRARRSEPPSCAAAQGVAGDPKPGAARQLLWLGLTACGSVMLLATTAMMCQDVAVVPLLWVVPLAIYLLSFILCFQFEWIYWRPGFIGCLMLSAAWTCRVMYGGVSVALRWQALSFALTLFAACMVCHGELVRLKPGPRHLTRFYLMVAGGGAAGGLFVTVAAPYLFRDYWEYHLGLAATGLLAIMLLFRSAAPRQGFVRMLEFWGGRAILCASWAALVVTLGGQIRQTAANSLATRRNFFGVLRVQELNKDDPGQAALSLMHGRIRHGFQFLDREKRFWPTTYYGPESGAGIAIRFHPRRLAQDVMRMGVIGLGTGTLAAYGRPGDSIRFYEINPEVLRLSDEYFTFRDCPARVEVVLGDARVSMERERERRECQRFDVLAIDAFSSDAIPVHLLTRECFEVYRYHLRKDGILAFHISNRYFDLSPVLRNLIDAGPTQDMRAIRVDSDSNASMGTDRSEWVLLTANREFLENQDVMRSVTPWNEQPPRTVWTDDYSGLFSLLRGNRNGDR